MRRAGGGYINEGWHVTLADGADAFVKTRAGAAPGEYAAEAAGLDWLREPSALHVPHVLEIGASYLALEWVEPGALDAAGAEELGRGLARIHAAGAPHFGDPRAAMPEGLTTPAGAATPTRFGSLQLPNDPARDWSSFYAEQRLLPLQRLAADGGWLTNSGARALDRIRERIVELSGPAEPPARLHGDLWSGNVHPDREGRPWLIDPTVYGGHREVDLAMLRLFGAPSERVFSAYEEIAPLSEGWEQRVGLWQLAPMLVHGVLFGESYCEAAQRIAQSYAG